MTVVIDTDGTRYVLLKRSAQTCLVREIATGETRYVDETELEPIEVSPLEFAADRVDDAIRLLVTQVHDDRTLGFLVELYTHGPTSVRTIMDRYDFCESDLNGRLTTLSTAGLISEVDCGGESGVATTDQCDRALEAAGVSDERP